jgi:hypothetical protein
LSTEDYSTEEKTKLGAISGTNTGDQDLSSYATITDLKANIDSPTLQEPHCTNCNCFNFDHTNSND